MWDLIFSDSLQQTIIPIIVLLGNACARVRACV